MKLRLFSLAALVSVVLIFLFLRWYGIEQSLFFFNDMGRDFLVLLDWQSSGKPPLLGPQTSVVSYNQSALYFYLLFPVFVVTHHWPFGSLLTASLVHIAVILLGWWYLQRQKEWQWWWLGVWLALAITPQLVLQHRFVWNPSFVSVCLVVAFGAWWQWREAGSKGMLALFGLSLAASTAFSYSAAPALVAWMIWAAVTFRNQWQKTVAVWLVTAVSLVMVNLPTLVFELRHGFFLTKLLIFGQKQAQLYAQPIEKLEQLLQHSLDAKLELAVGLLLLQSVVVAFCWWKWSHNSWTKRSQEVFGLLSVTVLVTWLVPFSIQSHYVFPLLTLWLVVLLSLPKLGRIIALSILAVWWLRPSYWQLYLKPAPRTVAETFECARQSCQKWDKTSFISAQADGYPYHNAMDFKYAFKEAGCDIKELDTQISEANHMLVVVDDSVYQHNQTAFNELTQFGPSQELERWSCNSELQVVALERL